MPALRDGRILLPPSGRCLHALKARSYDVVADMLEKVCESCFFVDPRKAADTMRGLNWKMKQLKSSYGSQSCN